MDFDALYLRALKFLSFRPRSEKEVRDYLQKVLNRHPGKFERTYPGSSEDSGQAFRPSLQAEARMTEKDGLIDLIISKLKQQKFINDTEFAKMWIRSRTSFKPKGWRFIKLELKQKGISDEIIRNQESEIKNQEIDIEDERPPERELAIKILARKRKKYEAMTPQERFRKAGSMLARRGFDLDSIKAAIDSVFGKVV